MKLRNMTVLAAVLALALGACGDGETTDTTAASGTTTSGSDTTTGDAAADFETVNEGVLTVCTDSPYPPMEFEVDGEFTGFDIELMRAIADGLGLGLEVNNTGFDPITSGLAMEAGDCDVAAASITITPERAEAILFSDGYFTADQSLLVKADSGLSTLADFDGESLGVQTGTTGQIYAEENAPEGAELVDFENPGDLFLALDGGQIAGILQDIIPNADRALTDDTVVVAETYPTDETYGFAAKLEGSEALMEAINAQLAALRADGTYDAIYEEFFPSAG